MYGSNKAIFIKVYINANIAKTEEFDTSTDTYKLIELEANDINLKTLRVDIFVAFRRTEHKKHFTNEQLKWYIVNYNDSQIINNDADLQSAIAHQTSSHTIAKEAKTAEDEENTDESNKELLQLRVLFEDLTAVAVVPDNNNTNVNVDEKKEYDEDQELKQDPMQKWLSVYNLESIHNSLKNAGYVSLQMFDKCGESDINKIFNSIKILHPMELKLKYAIDKYQEFQKSIEVQNEQIFRPDTYESECQGEKAIEECEKIHRMGLVMKKCQLLVNAGALSEVEYQAVQSEVREAISAFANYNRNHLSSIDFQLLTDDFNHIRQNDGLHNEDYHGVLNRLIGNFLGGIECVLEKCACIQRNSVNRDELHASNMHLEVTEMARISLIDKIHVQLFHGIDSGYRHSNKELQQIADACVEPEKKEDETDIDVGFGDRMSKYINDFFTKYAESDSVNNNSSNVAEAFIEELSNNYDNLCIDNELNVVQTIGYPKIERANFRKERERLKFVMFDGKTRSVINDIENENGNQNVNNSSTIPYLENINNDDEKINKSSSSENNEENPILYSPGVRFYYWEYYKKNECQDNINGDTYEHWYIPAKYKHVIEEFEQEQPIHTLFKEKKKSQIVMESSMVKQMKANDDFAVQYRIRGGQLITEVHVLCIIMYCNWTKFCTKFSSTYRRIPVSESDELLIGRHSHFHFYGRFLRETVECYGTSMKVSNIDVFYHGISTHMYFRRTFCRFCTPTSTTHCLGVAINFAREGLILALKNDEMYAKYFDVCLFSDYSNENELLFIGGANMIPIQSIRQMFHGQKPKNYAHFIVAITTLQQMCIGRDPDFKIRLRHKKNLFGLIVQRLQSKNMCNENILQQSEIKSPEILSKRIPKYITELFGHICDAEESINIVMKFFKERRKVIVHIRDYDEEKVNSETKIISNINKSSPEKPQIMPTVRINYCQYRSIFLMPNSEQQLNCLLFCQLFPNLKRVELDGVLIDEEILNAMIDHFLIGAKKMERFIVSLDTESPMTAKECIKQVTAKLDESWKMENISDRQNRILQKFKCIKNN